jgi:hypothetical protein
MPSSSRSGRQRGSRREHEIRRIRDLRIFRPYGSYVGLRVFGEHSDRKLVGHGEHGQAASTRDRDAARQRRILVVGGVDELTAELYDPPSGTWLPAGSLNESHWAHVAVRLDDGRVLVAGGGRYSADAELYNPATNSWTTTGSMNVGRISMTGTLLRDGRVLVVGGLSADGSGVQASAELYNPATGRWTLTGSLRTPRRNHTATLLGDGTVLVAGGFGNSWLQSAELYDPARGRWSRVASMTVARENASATLLGNGRVLVAAAVRLRDGRVLVAGGGDAGDVYSPATGTWTATGPRAFPLEGGGVLALLPSGQVIGVGGERLANCTPKGCGSEPVASAELYTPE